MIKRFITPALLLLIITMNSSAVDGIAVTVRNWTYADEGNFFDGDIYRIDVQNSRSVGETKLVSKPASQPHISPDGKRMAFLQNSHICLMDINGGSITQLCPCKKYVTIDFPNNDWVFWSNGVGNRGNGPRGYMDSSGMVFRVDANGGADQTPELYVTLRNYWLTRWSASNGDFPHWWKVDLQQEYTIEGTEIMFEIDGPAYQYKIETSRDNSNWNVAVDKTNNNDDAQIQQDTFTANNVRYIRVTITNTDWGWASFYDFKAFSNGTNVALNKPATADDSKRGDPQQGTVGINAYDPPGANDVHEPSYPIAVMGAQDLDVSFGMDKLCFHPNGPDGALPQHCYTIYYVSEGDGILREKNSIDRWACGGGMTWDGKYLVEGDGVHQRYDIRDTDHPDGVRSNNSIYKKVVCENVHWYSGTGASTNNTYWFCRGIQDGNRQCLYNWDTGEEFILGSGHGGDFWVGSQSTDPAMLLSPATLAFAAQRGGSAPAAQTVQISNGGIGTLSNVTTSIYYSSNGSGWLTVSRNGSGNSQTLSNSVSPGTLDTGAFQATVTVTCSNAVPATATYTVTFKVTDPSLQLGSVVITPAACTTHTWASVPFTAVAKATDGTELDPQPAFKWTVSGGQNIDSAKGTFFAGSVAGGPYTVTATATVGSVTKSGTATVLVTRPLTLSSPQEGATFQVGDTLSVVWVRNQSIAGLDVQFSSDGGKTYNTIIVPFIADTSTQVYNGTTGTIKWKIPASFTTATGTVVNCISTKCKVRLYGPYDAPASLEYSGIFTIGTTGIKNTLGTRTIPVRNAGETVLVYDIRGRLVQRTTAVDSKHIKLKASGVWIAVTKRPGQQPKCVAKLVQ